MSERLLPTLRSSIIMSFNVSMVVLESTSTAMVSAEAGERINSCMFEC